MPEKIIDIIKYEGSNDVLIYKHPITDFNLGTQLIVHESQEAVFFKDGKAEESFGPGRHTLETNNLPRVTKNLNEMAGGKFFHAEVYFINLTTELGVKWGTDSKIRMYDPISGLHLEIGACGTFNVRVNDGRKLLIKVVGTTNGFEQKEVFGSIGYMVNQSVGQFRGLIVSKVKSFLGKAIRENDIDILEVDEHIDELSEILRVQINEVLDEYGLVMPEFFITNIATPDDDPNFKKLKEQHAARFLKVQEQRIRKAELEAAQEADVVAAQTGAKVKVISAQAEAEAYKLKAEAEAAEMKMKGYTYSEETSRIVGKAAAENESGGGMSNVASDIVKTGVGLGVGVQVAGKVIDAVKPAVTNIVDNTWECPSCHHKGNKGKFCEECGYKKDETWICPKCGETGLTGKSCPTCGYKKEE